MYHPSLLYYFNETGQADRNKTEREQKTSKPLARSLQDDYSGSEEKKDEHMQESEEKLSSNCQ